MFATHELKTWPPAFEAILTGRKSYEIRRTDRHFAVGDTLWLREWELRSCRDDSGVYGHYTGREIRVVVTYLTPGGEWGLPESCCVMAIVRRDQLTARSCAQCGAELPSSCLS